MEKYFTHRVNRQFNVSVLVTKVPNGVRSEFLHRTRRINGEKLFYTNKVKLSVKTSHKRIDIIFYFPARNDGKIERLKPGKSSLEGVK